MFIDEYCGHCKVGMMELEEDGEWDHGWISILRLFISVIILLKPVFQIRNIWLRNIWLQFNQTQLFTVYLLLKTWFKQDF